MVDDTGIEPVTPTMSNARESFEGKTSPKMIIQLSSESKKFARNSLPYSSDTPVGHVHFPDGNQS